MDPNIRCTWSTSDVPSNSDYKPGGTGIVNSGASSSRIKDTGHDRLGRWSWQLLKGEGERDVLIVSVYQCCQKYDNSSSQCTAYIQQKILLSEQNRYNKDPRTNFRKDLISFIKSHQEKNPSTVPIILGDWNEECIEDSAADNLCNEFGLVNIFNQIYPHHKKFKTYRRGSKTIDYAIAPPDIADRVINFV